MKRYSIILTVAVLMFSSCRKEISTSPEGEIATVRPPDAGNIQTRIIASGLNFPWEILWGPDNHIWFTEREGRVKRLNPETGQLILVATISEVATFTDFNGLLGMALHPSFATNPFVYLVYNYVDPADGDYLEKVVRFTYNGTTLFNPIPLVDGIIGKKDGAFIHNGSRLKIGSDMKLYITTGDANLRFTLPQDINSLNGKTLRINLDGTIPADNPYGNQVWTLGHRNAQGLVFGNGKLYSSEHGEDSDDEINILESGRNYGWPFVEGFCDLPAEQTFCGANNVVEPIFAWTPTLAPSGIDFYNHNAIAQWKNSLLITFLKGRRMIQMKLNDSGTGVEAVHEFFNSQFGRLRDIAISPDGKVYICTDNGDNEDVIIEVTKGS